MKVLSLFSGIGAFDLGFGRAGMEIAGQVEIDRFCNRVLAARWPDVPRAKDVRDVRGDEFGPVDVVCFGSPCQDLSVAGKRTGLAGARSGLFFEAARIIAECRPAVAVWENVPGVLSSNAGRDFAAVLVQFRELGARDIAWRVVNARYAGVPQQRRRVFLVADFRGERAAEVLFEPEVCAGHPAPGGAAGQGARFSATDGARSGGRAAGCPEVAAPIGVRGANRNDSTEFNTYIPEVAYTLADSTGTRTGSGRDAQDTYIATLQDVRADKRQHGAGVRDDGIMYSLDPLPSRRAWLKAENGRTGKGDGAPLLIFDETQVTSPGNYSTPNADVSHPLAAGARPPAIAFDQHDLVERDQAASLRAESDGSHRATLRQGARIRYLTPLEQERCMGFPDGWTCLCPAGGDTGACVCPDGPRQRALGNALVVPVAQWIAHRIAAAAGQLALGGTA